MGFYVRGDSFGNLVAGNRSTLLNVDGTTS